MNKESTISLIGFVIIMIVMILFAFIVRGEDYTNQEICRAIYQAEGAEKAKVPYGILSVECEGKEECKQICLNTVRNNRKRYADYGHKTYDTYLEFLASRYAPIGAGNDPDNLNANWLGNVRYFLIKENK